MKMLRRCLISLLLGGLYVSSVIAAETVVTRSDSQNAGELKTAADFLLSDLEGHSKSLNSYQGQWLLLHFWATWCEPCREELPALTTLGEKFKNQGLIVIAIAEDSKQAVVPFVKSSGLTLPVLIDQYGSALRAYQIKGLPTSYLINRTRQIEEIIEGPKDWKSPTVVHALEKTLSRR
jgi:peroxiredoxin